jgi:beta-glucosidase
LEQANLLHFYQHLKETTMDPRTHQILNQMTLEEKCSMLSGMSFWETQAIERLGLPAVMMTDGPHGLRKQDQEADHLGLNQSVPATCFPSGVGLGSSWDTALISEVGQLLGREAKANSVSIVLGPACNIKRSPLCGRNFEYLSEDPFLSAQMAKHYIQGVQSQGVGTSIKHFCANNQETRRMTVDTIVDERTLREIYLASFEVAIREAQPWTVMCSYNKVNGTYLSDNKRLLTDILRDEWQYGGIVVSDWGAVHDRVAGVTAGLDLEMPSSGGINDQKVLAAVQNGDLGEAVVDQMVGRILDLIFKSIDNKDPNFKADLDAHHARARELAAHCVVLLKNEHSILPLQVGQSLAVIGAFADKPRYQGGGSSHINPTGLTRALHEIRKLCPAATYSAGFSLSTDATDEDLLTEAIGQARKAGITIIFAGLPDHYESEGYDRKHINLPPNQNTLIAEIAKVCPRVVVVLANGSPVAMPWIYQVAAVLEGYLPGQAGGGAIVDVLFGKANPSGKLAETFPMRIEDNPSFLDFPGFNDRVEYREGIFVGYRYYDKKAVDVLFPFGHGLSYTSFAYSNLAVNREKMTDNDTLEVTVTVENTGKVAGSEVVQLYMAHQTPVVVCAPQELKGFAKVALAPGEQKTVTLTLNRRSFAYYDVAAADWMVESGLVEIRIGASSRDIRLTRTVEIESTRLPKPFFTLNTTEYDLMRNPDSAAVFGPFFAQIGSIFHGPESAADAKSTPLPDPAKQQDSTTEAAFAQSEANPLARLEEEMALHMPMHAYPLISHGRIPEALLLRKIEECNALIQNK